MVDGLERFRALAESDPQAALQLLRSVQGRTFIPHPGQKPVVESRARFKVLNCGRRWGKTKVGARLALQECKVNPQRGGKTVWWVAPTYKVVKRGYREVLRQLDPAQLTHSPSPFTHFDAGRSVVLRFKNGNVMEFYSAERPGGMLGEGVDFAVLDEAATMPSTIWGQIVRPTLIDVKGRALLISTPRGRNWFYDRWLAGQDPEQETWASWTFTTMDNPHLPPEEFAELKKDLTRTLYQQEVLAEFLAQGSSVFLLDDAVIQYDVLLENGMVEDVSPKGQHVFLGIDLARSNDWTVLYGARERDRRNVFFERFNDISWKEQRRRIRRAVRRLLKAGATGVTIMADSTGVGDPVVEQLQDDGFDAIGINFTSTKNKMVTLLSNDLDEGRAHILSEGQKVEFENYGMSITATGRITYAAPEGQHDDVVSAKMLQHWGLVNEGVPGVETVSAGQATKADEDELDMDEAEWADLLDDEGDLSGEASVADTGEPETIHLPAQMSHLDLLKRGWF